LFGWGYVQKDLRNPNTVRDHHAFEFVDLFVASVPFALTRKILHSFDQDAPVPRAVENDDLTGVRQLFPKALQIVPATFV
jgi:hypothetical protein